MSIFAKKKQQVGLWGLIAVLAAPAVAQDGAGWCYQRIYSDDHLAKHPAQVVWQMRVSVGAQVSAAAREIVLEVIAANQGHARDNDNQGRVLTQALLCRQGGSDIRCAAECNAGGFDVVRMNAQVLSFETDFLMVGEDGCGGRMDLAEVPGQAVRYRMDRVDDAQCEGM